MSEEKKVEAQVVVEDNKSIELLKKIVKHKNFKRGLGAIFLVIIAAIPVLQNYKVTIHYCEDKTLEETCELISEDLTGGITDVIDSIIDGVSGE